MTDKNKFRLSIIGFVIVMALILVFWPSDPCSNCPNNCPPECNSDDTPNINLPKFDSYTPVISILDDERQIWKIDVWGTFNPIKFSKVFLVFSDGSKGLIRHDGTINMKSICNAEKLVYEIRGDSYYSNGIKMNSTKCEFATLYNPAISDKEFLDFVASPIGGTFSFSTLSNWNFNCIEEKDTINKSPFEMRLYLQIGTLKGKSFSVIDNATDIDNQIIYLKCD
ncbi:MAG: hypothetical protein CL823_05670 [Crocinitomicaceae bacterium]|nr:hypothetical protein [Crocinitomicaceae bacterium]